MAGERGSAVVAAGTGKAVLIVLSMSMLFHSYVANVAPPPPIMNYVLNWISPPQNHSQFYANMFNKTCDQRGKIYFRFITPAHNAYAVDADGYKNCKLSKGAIQITSRGEGHQLKSGNNYFICSIADQCTAGMKLNITAA